MNVMTPETVMFNGEEILFVKEEDDIYISLTRLCKAFNVGSQAQRQKVLRRDEWSRYIHMWINKVSRRILCIRLGVLDKWIVSINRNKVDSSILEQHQDLRYKITSVIMGHDNSTLEENYDTLNINSFKTEGEPPMNLMTHQFYGDNIFSIKDNQTNQIFVPLKPIVLSIGLSWNPQLDKIRKDPKWKTKKLTVKAQDGKSRSVICLPLDRLHGWLFQINSNKVRPDLKQKVEKYQDECFQMFNDYWNKGVAINPKLIRSSEDAIAAIMGQTDKLLGAVRQNLKMIQEQVAILQPKADYYDICMNVAGLKTVGQFARTLAGNIGRNKLFNYMNLDGMIFKSKSRGTWEPYQKYINQGYLEYKIGVTPNGREYGQVYITPKGELFIFKHLQHDGWIPKDAMYQYIELQIEENIKQLDTIEESTANLLSGEPDKIVDTDIKIPRGATIQ